MRKLAAYLALLVCICSSTTYAAGVTYVPPGLSAGDTYHIAFVTSGTIDGLSPNIADYNAFAQSQAELSGAETENWAVDWFAIASTITASEPSAADNIPVSTSPVYLLSGAKVADNETDLWNGTLDNQIDVDQFKASQQVTVWTGTLTSGAKASPFALGFSDSVAGSSSQSDFKWVQETFVNDADNEFHLYAVSQELVAVTIPEPSAFCTSMLFSGLGMIAGLGRRKRHPRIG
jgi:hypothetical protein